MVEFFNLFLTPSYSSTPVCKGLGQRGAGGKLENHCFKAVELCRWTHDLEAMLLSYRLHTSMMELQSKQFLVRVTFKIIYNVICTTPGCWISAVSLTETILSDGLCPRECRGLGEPGFRGGTPCAEHSLIHKDKYFTCGLTNCNRVSNNGKTNKLLESSMQSKTK